MNLVAYENSRARSTKTRIETLFKAAQESRKITMAECKGYKYKEENPESGKFHSNAEDGTFYYAEPLTDEDHKKAAEMWDRLTSGATLAKKIPGKRT
jgi:hypothetical protein